MGLSLIHQSAINKTEWTEGLHLLCIGDATLFGGVVGSLLQLLMTFNDNKLLLGPAPPATGFMNSGTTS